MVPAGEKRAFGIVVCPCRRKTATFLPYAKPAGLCGMPRFPADEGVGALAACDACATYAAADTEAILRMVF